MKKLITLLLMAITLNSFSQQTLNSKYQRKFKKLNNKELSTFLENNNFLYFDKYNDTINTIGVEVKIYYNDTIKERLTVIYCDEFKDCFELVSFDLHYDIYNPFKKEVSSLKHEYTSYFKNDKYYAYLVKYKPINE